MAGSRIIKEQARRAQRRQAANALGMASGAGLAFSSARALNAYVENPFRLPPVASNETLQDATGAFYEMDGYSADDTDDLPVPP